jgi:hypothetical protein
MRSKLTARRVTLQLFSTQLFLYEKTRKKKAGHPVRNVRLFRFGGGKRDRTADLLHAMQALSQLSYTPKTGEAAFYEPPAPLSIKHL